MNKGVVSAIAEVSAQVLDVTLKFRKCSQCSVMDEKKQKGNVTTFECLDWYVQHEPKCMRNHFGSPQKIESDGMIDLYQHSIKNYSIQYNPFIGDINSSSYSAVDKQRPSL